MKRILSILLIGTCYSLTVLGAPANPVGNPTLTTPLKTSTFKCTSDADCNFNGICDLSAGQCHCVQGFTEENCAYKQKKQLTAFNSNIALGFLHGGGNFYIGDNGAGAGKIVLFWGSLTTLFLNTIHNSSEYRQKQSLIITKLRQAAKFIGWSGIVGSLSWWVADIARFSLNDIKDSNGKELEIW